MPTRKPENKAQAQEIRRASHVRENPEHDDTDTNRPSESAPIMVLAAHVPGLVPIALELPDSLGQLDNLSASWLASLAVAGRSPATIRAYRSDLLRFLTWGILRGLRTWPAVDTAVLAAFLGDERARGIGLRLVARRSCTIRAAMAHAADLGHRLAVPVVRTRQPSPLAVTAERSAILRLLRSIRGEDFFALRDRAAIELLDATGITAAELCALDVDSLDLAGALLRVQSRTLISRRVPVRVSALEALRAWLPFRRAAPYHSHALALFTSGAGYRLTEDALSTLVGRRSIAAGIVPILTPRTIRNSFGVHLFESGAEEHQVAALMGISFRRAADLHRATNPHRRRSQASLRRLVNREAPSH